MAEAAAAFVHTWRVGRWTVTLSIPPSAPGYVRHAVAEWEPAVPGRRLTASEQAQYEVGLAEAMQLAQERMRGAA